MILKGLSLKDSSCEIEVHGQFSPPDFSDDCYELYTFSLYYGSYMFIKIKKLHVIIWNLMVKKITHKELYKIITRTKKLERINHEIHD